MKAPNLTAAACTTAFVTLLCAPMLAGQFLIGRASQVFAAGYAFQSFATDYVRTHGAMPQWNPYIFGGLPFVAAPHGATFHPVALLRLVLPTDLSINASFVLHLVLAGFFTYLLLREFGLPWVAAVAGGVAYQLTGQVASLVYSGQEGAIILAGLVPFALWGLTRWIRAGRVWGAAVLALGVGLAILSAPPRLAASLMIATMLFALYLAFLDPDRPGRRVALGRLAGVLATMALGVATAAIQLLPALAYSGLTTHLDSPVNGWRAADLINFLLPQFSALNGRHAGYIGVGALIVATIGVTQTHRSRLRWVFVVLAVLFPAFAAAVCVGLGVERVLQPERPARGLVAWLVVLGVVLIFGVTGAWSNLANAVADPGTLPNVGSSRGLLLGSLRVAVFGAATLGLLWIWGQRRVREMPFALMLIGLIGLDLYTIDREFFVFSPRARQLFSADAVTERLRSTPLPYRVWDPMPGGTYGASILMSYGIPQVLGYHGRELSAYDELLGGKNDWGNLRYAQLWRLLAIRYIILGDSVHVPGYRRILGPVPNAFGVRSYLYEADSTPPYVRVVPAAIKGEADRIIPTLIDPRLDYDRLVLFTPDEPVNPLPVDSMPPPSSSKAQVTGWEAGWMSIALDPVPPQPSYVLVSENWYGDWHATVDGVDARVLKGDQTFITVPVPTGARRVELVYRSSRYGTGRLISILATLVVLGCLAGPPLTKRFAPRG